MGALFSTIKAPPQNLDSLDDWGSLDELLWSLDSDIWNSAGLYALEQAVGPGESGEEVSAVRIRSAELRGSAGGGGTMQGHAVLSLTGSGAALLEGEQIGGVTVGIPVSPASAASGEACFMLRLQHGGGGAEALVESGFLPYRVRMTELSGLAAQTSEREDPNRVRGVTCAPSAAAGEETIVPEYKGWGWTELARREGLWRGVVQWQ